MSVQIERQRYDYQYGDDVTESQRIDLIRRWIACKRKAREKRDATGEDNYKKENVSESDDKDERMETGRF